MQISTASDIYNMSDGDVLSLSLITNYSKFNIQNQALLSQVCNTLVISQRAKYVMLSKCEHTVKYCTVQVRLRVFSRLVSLPTYD